ncbi:MAG: LysR family transcriptional regulator [Clostridia bacterium]|nr:LysR family transcriptional regulator [Clostridia bacterium]
MDLRLLEYVVAIEKYGNMTEAAAQLFVTPSALNQQLLKLEKDLNTPLFMRSQRRMVPTEAGKVYLEAAHRMLNIRQAAYAKLQDLSECITGTYRVGLTYDHGSGVFARVYPVFHQRYPGIQMRCYQSLVPEMLDLLARNDLDLVFLLGSRDSEWNGLEIMPLSEENLVLGVPRSHPLARNAPFTDEPLPAFDIRKLRDDPFALALKQSTMRSQLIDPIFEEAGFEPNIMVESSFNSFLEQLAAQGICSVIIPQSQVQNKKDVAWYYLQTMPRFRFSVGCAKGFRLNAALRYFIDLAHEDALAHLNFKVPPAGSAVFLGPAD